MRRHPVDKPMPNGDAASELDPDALGPTTYRALIDALPISASYIDQDRRYHFCNKAGEEWLGMPLAKVRGRHVGDVLAPSRYERIQPFLDRALSGQSATFEGFLDTASGEPRWVTADFVPETVTDGQVRGVFVFTREHSDHAYPGEATTHESVVFENMSDAVIITDSEDRITHWNSSATRIFGYERDEMIGRRVGRLYDLDDPLGLQKEVIAEMARADRWYGELRFIRKDRSTGICETLVVPLRNQSGERIATVGVNRDVTQRTRIEAELAKSHAILEAVIEETNDAIFVKDLQGKYVMINPAGARMLGKSPAEVIGKDDTELFSSEDAELLRNVDRQIMDTGVASMIQERVTFQDKDTLCWFLSSKAPWRDAEGNVIGLIGIARDVTELWQAQQLAAQRQTELAHVLRLKTMGEMAAGLAHELNQPLAAVTNYAQGCIRRLNEQTTTVEELLPIMSEISLQAIRAGNIIHRMHGMVRRYPSKKERFDVNELIRGTIQLMDADLRHKDILLQLQLGSSLQVDGDPIQVEQIILNLIKNAVEAMPDGGLLSIESALSQDDAVEISVSDTGPGLSEDQLQTIFDAFVTTKSNGLGMGLAISRSIAEAHGGRLSVSNRENNGAIFRLQLPRSVGLAG